MSYFSKLNRINAAIKREAAARGMMVNEVDGNVLFRSETSPCYEVFLRTKLTITDVELADFQDPEEEIALIFARYWEPADQ